MHASATATDGRSFKFGTAVFSSKSLLCSSYFGLGVTLGLHYRMVPDLRPNDTGIPHDYSPAHSGKRLSPVPPDRRKDLWFVRAGSS